MEKGFGSRTAPRRNFNRTGTPDGVPQLVLKQFEWPASRQRRAALCRSNAYKYIMASTHCTGGPSHPITTPPDDDSSPTTQRQHNVPFTSVPGGGPQRMAKDSATPSSFERSFLSGHLLLHEQTPFPAPGKPLLLPPAATFAVTFSSHCAPLPHTDTHTVTTAIPS